MNRWNSNIVVKFADTYSVEVHRFLTDRSCSPELLYQVLFGRFTADIDNTVTICSIQHSNFAQVNYWMKAMSIGT